MSAAASAGQCDLADRHFLAEDHLEVKKVVRHAWSLVGWGERGRTGRATPQRPRSAISFRETPRPQPPAALPLAASCDAVETGGGEPAAGAAANSVNVIGVCRRMPIAPMGHGRA